MYSWQEVHNDCSWPTWLRWLAFLPLGLIVTSLVQGTIRLSNMDAVFAGECVARAAEPWAFLMPALWVLPRFNKAFAVVVIGAYMLLQAVYTSSVVARPEAFQPQWTEITLAFIAFVSAGAAGWWALQQRYAVPAV